LRITIGIMEFGVFIMTKSIVYRGKCLLAKINDR